MENRLSEEEIYGLAERVTDWQLRAEKPGFYGSLGNIKVALTRTDFNGGANPSVEIVVSAIGIPVLGVTSSNHSSERAIQFYRRVDTEYGVRQTKERERKLEEGLAEARRLLAN